MHSAPTPFTGGPVGGEQWEKIFDVASTICHICQQETPSAFPVRQISDLVHQLEHEVSFLRRVLPYPESYPPYGNRFEGIPGVTAPYPTIPSMHASPSPTSVAPHEPPPPPDNYYAPRGLGYPPLGYPSLPARRTEPVDSSNDGRGISSQLPPAPTLKSLSRSEPQFWNSYAPTTETITFPPTVFEHVAPDLPQRLTNLTSSQEKVTPTRKRKRNAIAGRVCTICHEENTPEWRRGPDGNHTLCNACGLNYAKKMKAERTNLERMGRRKQSIDVILNTKKHQLTGIIQAERRRKRTVFSSFPPAAGDDDSPANLSPNQSPSLPAGVPPSSRFYPKMSGTTGNGDPWPHE